MSESLCCPAVCVCCGGSLGRSYHWTQNATYCERCHAEIERDRRKNPPMQQGLAGVELVQPQGARR
jgi:hypothetical protein